MDSREPEGEDALPNADTPQQSAEFILYCKVLGVSVASVRSTHKWDGLLCTNLAQPSPQQACTAPFAGDSRGAVSTANIPAGSDLARPLVLVSRSLYGLGINSES